MLLSFVLAVGLMPSLAYAGQAGSDVAAVAESGDVALAASGYMQDWTACGTCEWSIDADGNLVVRPANGASEGTLDSWYYGSLAPWCFSQASKAIKTARFDGTVHALTANGMFYDCTSLKSVDLSGLDTSGVKDLGGMFIWCSSLISVDLSGLDISSATSTEGMFYGCSSLKSVDLSDLDTSNMNWMDDMFCGCSSLRLVSLGEKFNFCGLLNEDCLRGLPTPSGDGLTGKWVSSADGKAYAADEIPSNVAATYVAEGVATFPDVDYSQWYGSGVLFCSENGLITGYGSGDKVGQFGVGDTLTRAQLAVILWRNAEPEAAAAYDGTAGNGTGMSDVASGDYYTAAANWAVSEEVINGSDDADGRHFNPDKPVTMEQLATILANYADKTGAESADLSALSSFTDQGSISSWALGSVAWAKQKGLVSGYDNHNGTRTLNPQENVARERVATVLANAFESGTLE